MYVYQIKTFNQITYPFHLQMMLMLYTHLVFVSFPDPKLDLGTQSIILNFHAAHGRSVRMAILVYNSCPWPWCFTCFHLLPLMSNNQASLRAVGLEPCPPTTASSGYSCPVSGPARQQAAWSALTDGLESLNRSRNDDLRPLEISRIAQCYRKEHIYMYLQCSLGDSEHEHLKTEQDYMFVCFK